MIRTNTVMNIEDLIRMEENGEVAYNTDLMPDRIFSPGIVHQPFVVALDISRSMTHKTDEGKSKLETCVSLINNLCYSDALRSLSATEQNSIDMLVMSFEGKSVYLNAGWMPVTHFEGIGKTKTGGDTPLYKTIIESVNATRAIRHHYSENGIGCARPYVFICTDGRGTDRENKAAAMELCRKYAGKDGKVKIFVFLIPGKMSDSLYERTVADMTELSDNITVIKIADSSAGLPAAFEFLASSVVVGASSSVGTEMKVKYDPSCLSFAGNIPACGGYVNIGIR